MDRRDFLKTVAITGAAMTIQRSEGDGDTDSDNQ